MGNLTRYTSSDLPALLDKISKNSIGMNDYLNRVFDLHETTSNYPPYNLITVSNTESRLELALAGFKKKEVNVYTQDGKLFVCLLYTSPSPRDYAASRMPSSA